MATSPEACRYLSSLLLLVVVRRGGDDPVESGYGIWIGLILSELHSAGHLTL